MNKDNNAEKKGKLKTSYAYFHYLCTHCQERMQEKNDIHSKDQKDIDFEQIFLEICF